MNLKRFLVLGTILLLQACISSDSAKLKLEEFIKRTDVSQWEIIASNTRELKSLDISNKIMISFFVPESYSIVYPAISRDGQYLSYLSFTKCSFILHEIKSNKEEIIFSSHSYQLISSSWAHDDKRLAFVARIGSDKDGSLFIYNLENKSISLILKNKVKMDNYVRMAPPSWSLDDKKILVTSDELAVLEISIKERTEEIKIKGESPIWIDNEQFLFRDGDSFYIFNNASKTTQFLFSEKEIIGYPTLSPCGKFLIFCRSNLEFDFMHPFRETSDIIIWDIPEKKYTIVFDKILWFDGQFAWRSK